MYVLHLKLTFKLDTYIKVSIFQTILAYKKKSVKLNYLINSASRHKYLRRIGRIENRIKSYFAD